MPIGSLLLNIAADSTAQTSRVGQAISLFLIVGAILGILVIAVLLVTLARHIRRGRDDADEEPAPIDAWQEAGRRARPFESESEQAS